MSWNRIALLLMAVLALPARVWAAGDGFIPPEAAGVEDGWFRWLCLGVFIVLIGVAGFKPSKRTHLD